MNIALAQLNYHIGNFEVNKKKIIQAINHAKDLKADIIVFAEMAICGYPPRDFLEFDDFIEQSNAALQNIAKECDNIAAIIGAPRFNYERKGKKLFNSAFFIADKKIHNIIDKTLLPTYDIFDEYRYFEPNNKFKIIEYQKQKIAITICEDLWNINDDGIYQINPMEALFSMQPDIIINIAASPFSYSQEEERKKILISNVKKYHIPLIYVNHIGAQTEMLFDGGSMAIDLNGLIVEELAYFKEDLQICSLEKLIYSPKEIKIANNKPDKIKKIHDALVMGIKNYFEKQGFQKAILGLSGGIDSAVVLALAVEALGNKNVLAVMLPSQYSSSHSITDAKQLVETLNVKYEIINIQPVVDGFLNTLSPIFKDLPSDVTEENLQARTRGVILMALSNKYGSILLNTSNKSEIAVGYGTLYGDMCGGISVIGDIYKTEVYQLAQYINKDEEIIPQNIILKPPSAELKPNQKDTDTLPDYDILDKILYKYIELRQGPNELIKAGFDKTLVHKILKMVNTNEYKRYQTPPILRVSPKAFGMGRRLPIVAKYLS
jgi:NAD+ synthase (glutamine-hydrolysing)